MKTLLALLLLIPSLSWGFEKKINCDYFMNSLGDQEFNNEIKSFRIFNTSYIVTSGKTLDVLDFNLSSNFLINLSKISKQLNPQSEVGLLLSQLNDQLNQIDIAELNLAMKGWLLPQLQMYSNISNENNLMSLDTVLENGVYLRTIVNYSNINSNNINIKDTFLFYVNLADTYFKFDSECT